MDEHNYKAALSPLQKDPGYAPAREGCRLPSIRLHELSAVQALGKGIHARRLPPLLPNRPHVGNLTQLALLSFVSSLSRAVQLQFCREERNDVRRGMRTCNRMKHSISTSPRKHAPCAALSVRFIRSRDRADRSVSVT